MHATNKELDRHDLVLLGFDIKLSISLLGISSNICSSKQNWVEISIDFLPSTFPHARKFPNMNISAKFPYKSEY